MKKKLLFLLLFFFIFALPCISSAQAFKNSNSWINYSQPYYKFKILNDQYIYKIPYSTLSKAGLGSVPGSRYQLFKNGKEVALFVTTTGSFGANDYIEFYGTRNDGWVDSALYMDGAQPFTHGQANTELSMFTDSSAYYLTYNTDTHLRYKLVTNNLTNHPPAQAYCLYTVLVVNGKRNYFYYYPGFAVVCYSSDCLYLPEWDNGEGFISGYPITNPLVSGGQNIESFSFNAPYVYTSGSTSLVASVTGSFWGYSGDPHQVQLGINTNGTNYTLYSAPYFIGLARCDFNFNINNSYFNQITSNTAISFSNANSTSSFDEDAMAHISLQYPRLFNFGGNSVLNFVVPGSSGSNEYLAIGNYNNNNTTPLIFDLTNLVAMQGITGTNDSVYFNLPPSAVNRSLIITSQATSDIDTIPVLQKEVFVDYTNPANEGDFIIISNPVLYNDGKGNNYVQQYADFKNSCGYHSIVVDINQLYDQFAYGVARHPLSIRNFALYARQHWTIKPKYILLIGKGSVWEDQGEGENFTDDPADYIPICLVPTFGTPGADELFTATTFDPTPAIPVGRISTTNPADIAAYLQKAKDFVSNQTTTPTLQTIANKLWQKNILHFGGGSDEEEESLLELYLSNYQSIIDSPRYGGNVTTFLKSSPNPVQQATTQSIYSAINNGVSLITFYGHSSSGGFDFSVDNPADLNNYKKYPMIISNGCYLGDIFQLSPGVNEQYVNIPDKGAIAFLGSSYLAGSNFLFPYSQGFYKGISNNTYNNGIGDAIKYAVHYVVTNPASPYDGNIIFAKLSVEQMVLCGDPSLGLNNHAKPDYDIEPSTVHFSPSVITAATSSFNLVVYPTNLGMAIDTTFYISVTRTFPNGNSVLLYQQQIKAPLYQDSVKFIVYTDSTIGYGLNKFTVTLDSKNQIDEITKINNSVTVDLYISGNDLMPAYPYNYSIVNAQNITNNKGLVLKASTVTAFAAPHKYDIQIDTTALFNSPLMQSYSPFQSGGVVKWKPNITLHDSTVYYWRTAYDTLYNGQYNWHTYSFIYLPKSSPGWNQSHFYQYLNDAYANIYDSTDREFYFIKNSKSISAETMISNVFGGCPLSNNYQNTSYDINGVIVLYDNDAEGPSGQTTLMIAVFDSSTGLPILNPPQGGGYGLWGSFNDQTYPLYGFFYNTTTAANEATVVSFINNHIPKGDYVLGFTMEYAGIQRFNPAMLNALKTLGCTSIDTVTYDRPYMFFGKKGGSKAFPTTEILATSPCEIITGNFTIKGNFTSGYVQSPVIGPAQQWSSFYWKHHALQKPSTDSASVTILGVNNAGGQTVLYKAFTGTNLALNFINPKIYPTIIVQENTTDTIHKTPAQLNAWRINYQPMPDAALNPNSYFTLSKDTPFQQGEPFGISVDVDNITDYNMDSLWMKYLVISSSGGLTTYFSKRHPLGANDSLHANFSYTVPNSNNTGINSLFIEANPYEHHQPEEYHYNNLGNLSLDIQKNLNNPVLDVTFNGVHILNNDIVSAKPNILIRLKDQNPYLALRDTGLITVFLEYPGNPTTPVRVYYKNGTNMLFTPAPASGLNSSDNACTVTYNPTFTVDGTYTLIVEAHDSAGNVAGTYAYQVAFEVINKEMISSVLNYPNPFTSSTRFVFTITGSQVPSFFKIEIMTITGKVVKEITQNDIGPLHIGTNISQYAWNGTDQYGNPVGNGLYIYRVVASIDGEALAHYDSGADQYITSGMGKMYLMR